MMPWVSSTDLFEVNNLPNTEGSIYAILETECLVVFLMLFEKKKYKE